MINLHTVPRAYQQLRDEGSSTCGGVAQPSSRAWRRRPSSTFAVTASAITLLSCALLGALSWLLPPDGRRVMGAVVGLRFRRDERAFVTRSGEALRIVQRDATRTYVSMDDADEAAAVLIGLVTRDVRS